MTDLKSLIEKFKRRNMSEKTMYKDPEGNKKIKNCVNS